MKTPPMNQRGSAIIETLVAITLIATAVAGASPLITACVMKNESARSYNGVSGDVQNIFDGYRTMSFDTLLNQFGSTHTTITDGQTATATVTSATGHASYTVKFTAVKKATDGIPEAVKLLVTAEQQRRRQGDAIYSFETLIARVH